MNILTPGDPTARSAASDGAFRSVVPEPGPGTGWVVLRNCALGGGGPRVSLALLHPNIGVALVDFAATDTDAIGRFRSALDARRFPAIFGGYPPVARAVLPAARLPDLGRVLSEEFKAQPPLSLAGGDAWVRSARAAIEAEAPVGAATAQPLRPRRGGHAFPWRAAACAVAVGGLVGLLTAVLVLPNRRSEHAGAAAGLIALAPGVGAEALPGADQGGGGLTALDVRAALASAEAAFRAGAEVATEPRESGGAPPAVAATEERPDEPPEPAAHAAAPPVPDAPHASGAEALPDMPATTAETQPPTAPIEAVAAVPPEPERAPTAAASAGGDAMIAPPTPSLVFDNGPAPQAWPDPPGKAPPDAPGGASANLRPAAKRPAAIAEAPQRTATPSVATAGRRTALPTAPAEIGGGGRCGAILARTMVGGPLSDDDREFLRRGCDRRG